MSELGFCEVGNTEFFSFRWFFAVTHLKTNKQRL